MQAAYEAGTITLDQLLEAQRLRADAQISFFRTLLDYQRGIIMIHFRKGTLLEYNNVYLAEGPWPAKAKFDAHRLARQRDASLYINYGFTRPSVMSQGPVNQTGLRRPGEPAGLLSLESQDGVPHEAAPEELPTTNSEAMPTTDAVEPPQRLPEPEPAPSRAAADEVGGEGWADSGLGQQPSSQDAAVRSARNTNDSLPSSGIGAAELPGAGGAMQWKVRRSSKASANVGGATVRAAGHEWKSARVNESVENQSSRSNPGSAASDQGP